MEGAEAAKAEGNTHFAARRYPQAIASYTRAIELDSTKPAYYSNRSGAYLASGDIGAALDDAKKCISLDREWAKGHSRKGAALFAKRLFGQAAAAYTKAAELDPTKDYQSRAERAELERKYASGELQRPEGSTPPPPPNATASAGAANVRLGGFQRLGLFGLRAFMFFNALMYLLPIPGLGGFARASYRRALIAAAVGYAVQVYGVLPPGRPQFTAAYWGPVIQDWRSHYLFMSLIFSSAGQPSVLFLLPILLAEAGHLGDVGSAVLARYAPGIGSFATASVSRALPMFVRKDPQEWASQTTANKWSIYNTRVVELQAQAEVVIALWLIVELVLTRANLLVLGIYWQSMRLRYIASPQVQVAFRGIDQMIRPVVTKVPLLGTAYVKVTKAMGNLVDVQRMQQRQAAGSKCSVM